MAKLEIRLEIFQYNVYSEDERREGEYLGIIYLEASRYVFSPEVEELLAEEMRDLADTLDRLNKKED
jgi:hypothetical protein